MEPYFVHRAPVGVCLKGQTSDCIRGLQTLAMKNGFVVARKRTRNNIREPN
jgi:hypothetical protein